jgi:hypothetical protein
MSISVTQPAGTSFDPANPGPIGGTTPNTIAATEISVLKTALGTTPTMGLALSNTTAAAAGAQQVSPSLVLEGRGWKTDATAASQSVRVRHNVLPIQGAAAPSAAWRVQADINEAGTWTDMLYVAPQDLRLYSGANYTGFTTTGFNLNFVQNGVIQAQINNAGNINATTFSVFGQVFLAGPSAATLQLGVNHATTPTAQRIQAHGVTTGTGASLTLGGGSGSAAKGNVILDGGNRAALVADATDEASAITLVNALKAAAIAHGLMAAA